MSLRYSFNRTLWYENQPKTGFVSQFGHTTLWLKNIGIWPDFSFTLTDNFDFLWHYSATHPAIFEEINSINQINGQRIPTLSNVKDLNPWNGLAFPLLKKVPSKIPEMILRRVTVKNGDLIKRILKYRFLKTGLNLIEFGNRRNKKSTMDAFTRYLARSKCGQ